MSSFESIHGCLLGGAVGDALGLPAERLTPERQQAFYGALTDMQFLPGRGMISDDTEHALFTGRALLESNGDAPKFGRLLRSEFRRWFLALPPGIGMATLRSGFKALVFHPNSGVFSAGNGPAMRAPILGACLAQFPEQLRQYLEISTRMTHTDPKALWGAVAVALASSPRCPNGREVVRAFKEWSDGSDAANECEQLLKKAVNSAARGQTTQEFCGEMGLADGVSGYIFHTVPVVLQCLFKNPTDFRAAVEEVVACGGDCDTTGAILGGILGSRLGVEAVPKDWRESLWEWPNTPKSIENLARSLSASLESGGATVPPRLIWPFQLGRNFFFLIMVLAHATRRLMPPYK
jgi:ADP-ribosyl-[dinitrogen reductase] hydrolase